MTELSDEILIKQILESRDTDAYSEIVSRYKNAVFKICVSITGNYHTAEDISQETFIDGYMKLASLREHDKILPWLSKIARNKSYNYLTRSSHLSDLEIGEYEHVPDLFENSPEMRAIQNDDQKRITEAVSHLPEQIKSAVELYYFKNMTIKRTAEILQVSERVIKYRLSEARKKLKKELDYMNTNIDKDYTLSSDFEKTLKAKIDTLKDYYQILLSENDLSENFSEDRKIALYNEVITMAEKVPESKEKHNMLASIQNSAPWSVRADSNEIKKHAELGENSDVIGDLLLDEIIYSSRASYDEQIKRLTEEAIPTLEALGNHDKKANCIFWRGTRYFITGNYISAKKDFEDSIEDFDTLLSPLWIATAYAGIRMCDIALTSSNISDNSRYSIYGEALQYKDGKLLCINQYGIKHSEIEYTQLLFRYINIFSYLSRAKRLFFDENMEIGDSLSNMENGQNNEIICMGKNESVAIDLGTFDDCIKMVLKCSSDSGNIEYYNSYTAEAWYSKDIGLVKADFKAFDGREEHYELSEYTINGGSGYMPFAKGNLWRYKFVGLPEYWNFLIEREVIESSDGKAYMTSLDYMTLNEDVVESCGVDPEICFLIADKYYEKFNYEKAEKVLRAIVRTNASLNATSMALTSLDNIKRIKQYHEAGYKKLFAGISGDGITKSDNCIKYENETYSLYKQEEMTSTVEGVFVWRMRVLNDLSESAGTLYNSKWTDGYKERRYRGTVNVDITIENAGTVSVKCGTFENCLKLTIEENEFKESENAVLIYSIKTYWFAPEVGVIRHHCRLNMSKIDCTSELAEYSAISAKGEYMPVYIGNRWTYEQTDCGQNYISRSEYRIENGISNSFFVTHQRELIFKGLDEDYQKHHEN